MKLAERLWRCSLDYTRIFFVLNFYFAVCPSKKNCGGFLDSGRGTSLITPANNDLFHFLK